MYYVLRYLMYIIITNILNFYVMDTLVFSSWRGSLGGSTSSKRSASAYYIRFRIMPDFLI